MPPSTFPPKHWRLAPWQREVWNQTRDLAMPRTIWMCCGRGAGKDIVAIRCAIRDALKLYRSKASAPSHLVLNPKVRVWILAPSEHSLVQTREDVLGELRNLQTQWCMAEGELFRHHRRDCKISIFGRGEIEMAYLVTTRPDSLRGPGVDIALYTELGAEMREGGYREELQGTLTRAGRLGRLYAYSTPKGPQGLFFQELRRFFGGGEEGEKRLLACQNQCVRSENGLELYAHADSFANTFLTPEQVRQIQAEDDGGWQYKQERLARFVIGDLGGDKAFERHEIDKCLVSCAVERPGYRRYSIGVDVARYGEDDTCLVCVDEDSGDLMRVQFFRHFSGPETVRAIEALAAEFKGAHITADSTGHTAYVSDWTSLAVEDVQFSRRKERWVGGLRMLLQMGKLRIPNPDTYPGLSGIDRENIRKLLRQLYEFVRVVRQNGGIDFRHPPGEHDDGVDGLILATMRMATRIQGTIGPEQTRQTARGLMI